MMDSLRRIVAIVRKEVRQLLRDKMTFAMIVGIPLLQIIVFGYAINTDVRHLSAAVADHANTSMSRRLVLDTQATQVIDIKYHVQNTVAIETLLRHGKITVGIVIPPDFEQRSHSGMRPAAQLLVDGSDPTAVAALANLRRVPLVRSAPQATADTYAIRTFYNPERRSAVNVVPGLIGVILTMTMTLFTAVAIVREKERGNMELLITTPVRTAELMIGKILPYILIGLIQTWLILYCGALLFAVPVVGSFVDAFLAAGLLIAANLALGLLISTLANTQFQAMQMTFFFFLPSILLSGFMFPFDGMPRAAQYIAEALPLTHFLRLIRGIILKGAGIGELLTEVYALLAFILVFMTIAIAKFHKSLD